VMNLDILVAEDDHHTRAALAEVLRGDGHRVTEAANGREAKLLFDQHMYDVACLDVMMPGMSGYDLCRHLRQVCPRLPILFITAKADEIDKVVGLELGADDYIVKPFGTKEVLARIQAVARRCLGERRTDESAPPLAQHDFWMDDLEVMPRRLKARRAGTSIDLSARELRILQLLASKPGEVVHRSELFRVAWQDNHVPNSRTVDQTISQLRKRIERDPRQPRIIQTVYAVGYRFEP
jgi:DNA-binding response OmpR family regulator